MTNRLCIGILREEKQPADRRAAISPKICQKLLSKHPEISIFVQPSPDRAFKEEEYIDAGATIQEDLSHCELLLGVKEVPAKRLIAEKDYMFFSHTIKKQPYNLELLQTVLAKKVRLIDYETLVDDNNKRLIGFGRFAGLVGAYNALLGYGLQTGRYTLKRAIDCKDLEEVKEELKKVDLPPIHIVVTGKGRVGTGVHEMLASAGIHALGPVHYLSDQKYDEPVFCQIDVEDYNKLKGQEKDVENFSHEHFFNNPTAYESAFEEYYQKSDMLIAAAYWDPKAPVLFTKDDLKKDDFRIKHIADITCDINGSVPTTIRSCVPADPFYDYDIDTATEAEAFSEGNHIHVMAVDTLPGELPRDASNAFAQVLQRQVIPHYLENPDADIILRGAITNKEGKLTERFEYLQDWVDGKE